MSIKFKDNLRGKKISINKKSAYESSIKTQAAIKRSLNCIFKIQENL